VVEYRYDAWGKLLATTGSMAGTLGKLNPFRYRGYIYDEETGLYWIRSRYYNPEWKRFVNADSVAYLGADGGLLSYNLFAYCGNDPVVRTDEGITVAEKAITGKKVVAVDSLVSIGIGTF
jgi:RHS repeat-associated protein